MAVKKAVLVLESGRFFEGVSCGYDGETFGECVFNTSLSGYQEILTDPSYYGQLICMTYPHIGNYGVNPEDMESSIPAAAGFIMREASSIVSNWRSTSTLQEFLTKHKVVAIEGVDTRALTRHLRQSGAMRGVISTKELNVKRLLSRVKKYPTMAGSDLVQYVTCKAAHTYTPKVTMPSSRFSVAVIDCGCKENILHDLAERGCALTVYPATTPAYEILAKQPDGIFLSNGPGDPAAVTYVVKTVQEIIAHNESAQKKIPLFGICLGHQMLGLALGGTTYKLKFGHRGANHPVKDVTTKKIEITSQNHGFCVRPESLQKADITLTHHNLYDGTSEGIAHKWLPMFSVQYHPEASPGPHESKYLFDRFITLMEKNHA